MVEADVLSFLAIADEVRAGLGFAEEHNIVGEAQGDRLDALLFDERTNEVPGDLFSRESASHPVAFAIFLDKHKVVDSVVRSLVRLWILPPCCHAPSFL